LVVQRKTVGCFRPKKGGRHSVSRVSDYRPGMNSRHSLMALPIDSIAPNASTGSRAAIAGVIPTTTPATALMHFSIALARLLGLRCEDLRPFLMLALTLLGCFCRMCWERLAMLRKCRESNGHLSRCAMLFPYGSPRGLGLISVVSPHLGHLALVNSGSRSKNGSLPQLRQIQAFFPCSGGYVFVMLVSCDSPSTSKHCDSHLLGIYLH